MTDKDKEIQTLRRELEKERDISRRLYAKLCAIINESGACDLCQKNPMTCRHTDKNVCDPTPKF